AKASIPGFDERSRLANRREGAIHEVWLKLLSCNPAQDLCWRVTTIFPLFMSHVTLVVVIQDPFLVRCNQIIQALRRSKIPVSHPSLDINGCLYQILPALPFLILFLLHPEGAVL